MKTARLNHLIALAAVLLSLAAGTLAGASPAEIRDVPRPAFVVLQKLASNRVLEVFDPGFQHLPENARAAAQQRYDAGQRELIAAAGDPDWFSTSKRAFIQAVTVDGRFEAEVHPLPRPGFRPPAVKFTGRLTPENRQRLLALLPPPFPESGSPREWVAHGREGWKALLAFAAVSPAQFDETVTALTTHLRPLAARSRLNNQFKPLQDELARLAELAKVHDQDPSNVKIRASVLTRALLFAAAQTAAQAAQPEVPAYIYARYEVQPVDRQYLPFAETTPAGSETK
ncbi:MAG TPA: hypothetical protein PKY38_03535 [Opitutaceae bacterium]|nr:hypothetical protein [Opitutaceae bacterium]